MPRDGVYVYELNSGWFYVGSSGNVDNRIEQHKSSPVVSRHGGMYERYEPITERQANLRSWEQAETLHRMMKHGIHRVRGWEFQGDTLSLDDLQTIKTLFFGEFDLCRRCGFRGHYQGRCSTEPRRRAAWLCEIERLQMESQQEELVSNMANMSIPSATPASTSRRGSRWSEQEENQLRQEIESGVTLEEVATIHRRTPGAIQERASRLGLDWTQTL
jgi:hypothetical protein